MCMDPISRYINHAHGVQLPMGVELRAYVASRVAPYQREA